MANELTLPDVLAFEPTRELVKQLKVNKSVLQDLFQMGPGQANTVMRDGDKGSDDIFDDLRTVPTVVSAGASYPQSAPAPVGRFDWAAIRAADEIPHTATKLHLLRAIGGPDATRDVQGRRYLAEQLTVQKGRFGLLREVGIAGILRDSLHLKPSGTQQLPTFTSTGAIQVKAQIPAGHKSQLDILGGGNIITASFATASTKIVEIWYKIADAAMQEAGSVPNAWLWNSTTWGKCIPGNTQIKDLAGSSNTIWTQNTIDPRGLRTIVLAGMPDVTHYIYDGVVTLDGSTVKLIPDDLVVMFPAPAGGQDWLKMIEGSDDYAINGDDQPDVTVFGQVFYMRKDGSKTSSVIQQRGNDLFVPYLVVPKAVYPATVVF